MIPQAPLLGKIVLKPIDDPDNRIDAWAALYGEVGQARFFDEVAKEAKRHNYELIWADEIQSAVQYQYTFGKREREMVSLCRSVSDRKLAAIGLFPEAIPEDVVVPEVEAQEYLTITEHTITPLPDQTGIPFWDQEWIAPELKDLLFGQTDENTYLRTYFIVDVTLRKEVTGYFDLDLIDDVPILCLFKGQAAEDLKEAAPYLIDMTLPEGAFDDKDKVPDFHKDFFKKHWERNTGIFVRTTGQMEQVRGHFRKFNRIQMEDDGRWVYFRFADPRTVSAFVEALDENDMHKFLGQHLLINPALPKLKAYQATNPVDENQWRALPPVIIKPQYVAAFGVGLQLIFQKKVKAYICAELQEFNALTDEKQEGQITRIIKQAIACGINVEKAVADFTLASVLFGDQLIKDPQFEQIIKSNKHSIDKARLLLKEVRFRQSPTKI